MQSPTYNILLGKISATRSRESGLLLLNGLLRAVGAEMLVVLLASLVEMLADGDTTFRTALMIGCLAIAVILLFVFVMPQILRLVGAKWQPSINDIALRIGEKYPNVKDKLGNAIQLIEYNEKNIGASQTLVVAELEDTYSKTKDLNFNAIIDKKKNRFGLLFFFGALLLSALTFSISDGMSGALYRLQHYSQSFIPPAPFELQLKTKDLTLLRNSRVEILLTATGQAPDYINLLIKEDGQESYDEFRLKRSANNEYKYEIASAKQNMEFYGSSDWLTSQVVTELGHLKVIDRPNIRSLNGTLHYPKYTKLASRAIDDQSADLMALRGSDVAWTITTNKPLKNAYVVFEKTAIEITDSAEVKESDTLHIDMRCDSNRASASMRITQNGFYYFMIEDFDGEYNINPIKYSVVALSDGSPSISLIMPTADVQVTEQALLPVKTAISDDYGFSSLKLYYRIISSNFANPEEHFHSLPINISTNDIVAEISYVWDLNKLNMMPEDVYEFYLEVADNDFTSGPKTAKTQTLKVRLPSMAEVSKEADKSQQNIAKELSDVKKESEALKKDIENLNRDLMKDSKKKDIDWKQQKQVQDIMNKQQKLQEKMDDLSQKMQETTKQLQQNNMLSQETIQKYQELQKLMQEVRSPQLDAMQQMQKDALQKLNPDELRKMMEQAKFDEERFSESIDRTMKVLKRMQAEQKTDALTKRVEALKKQQDELNKELNKNTDKNKIAELSQKQEQLKADMDKIAQEMKDLEQMMKEFGEDMPQQAVKDVMDEIQKQDISKDMQQASQQMQQGNKQQSSKSQQSASKKLGDLAQKMQQLKQQMQDQNSKEVQRRMQKAIEAMNSVSKKQEAVKNQTKRAGANSTRIPEIAGEQSDVFADLYNVAMELNEIGAKSFAVTPQMAEAINDAMKQIRNSMNSLTERNMTATTNAQTVAMKDMNEAMLAMQNSLSQMQGGGSCDNPGGDGQGQGEGQGQPGMGSGQGGGMGMQQMLSQMAAQQQAMMQQMQQMMGGQGGDNGGNQQMSQEQRAAMKRLSNEQGQMQKSMEQLAKEQGNANKNANNLKPEDKAEQQKLANELKKLADEMKEVQTDINRGNITPETLKRQERILSRMLDATKSINDRDYQKKRESKTGINQQLRSPDGIDLSTQEGKAKAMRDLMQSIKNGYTKDYEQVIRQYFEAIQTTH